MLHPLDNAEQAAGLKLSRAYQKRRSYLLIFDGFRIYDDLDRGSWMEVPAALELGLLSGWGSVSTIEIVPRPFTPLTWKEELVRDGYYTEEEMNEIHLQHILKHERTVEERERYELARLKAKYEPEGE